MGNTRGEELWNERMEVSTGREEDKHGKTVRTTVHGQGGIKGP